MSDIKEFLLALRGMGDFMEDNHGNLSMRTGKTTFVIKPSGMPFDKITEDDLVHVDRDGKTRSKNGRRASVDTEHHRNIYKLRPDVVSVCHTHTKYAVVMSTAGDVIPAYTTEQADRFGHCIWISPYARYDQPWPHKHDVTLMANHGALVLSSIGPSDAIELACNLESVCERVYMIVGFGGKELAVNEALAWRSRYLESYGQGDRPNRK